MTVAEFEARCEDVASRIGEGALVTLSRLLVRVYERFGFHDSSLRRQAMRLIEHHYGEEPTRLTRWLILEAIHGFDDEDPAVPLPVSPGPLPVLEWREAWPTSSCP